MPRNTSSKFKTAKQRAGKSRAARTSINTIVKRALSNAGAAPQRRYAAITKEIGYVDVATAAYACDTTGSITHLNIVAQGAATNQRVGKRIKMTSLQHRGLFTVGTAATINDVVMMIVYDKRPTGSLPAITDILNASSSYAQNKDDNVPDRFMILKRAHVTLTGNSTTPATGREGLDSDFYLPMRLPVTYKAVATGAIGDVEEGALYLVTVGNIAAGSAAAQVNGTFRVRYVDV